MSVTPIINPFFGLSLESIRETEKYCQAVPSTRLRTYESPDVFSSALKPLCPQWSQTNIRYIRCRPVHAQDIRYLKVRPFKLAPKRPVNGPVDFKDIHQQKSVGERQSHDIDECKRGIIADPAFWKALAKHQIKKMLRSRRHSKQQKLRKAVNIVKTARTVTKPSTPFDEDADLDPFMLFEDLQWPFSPLKNDSERYREEAEAALAAKEERYRARRGDLTVDKIKDMIHMTFDLGKYAPSSGQLSSTPESIRREVGSPMDVD